MAARSDQKENKENNKKRPKKYRAAVAKQEPAKVEETPNA